MIYDGAALTCASDCWEGDVGRIVLVRGQWLTQVSDMMKHMQRTGHDEQAHWEVSRFLPDGDRIEIGMEKGEKKVMYLFSIFSIKYSI